MSFFEIVDLLYTVVFLVCQNCIEKIRTQRRVKKTVVKPMNEAINAKYLATEKF